MLKENWRLIARLEKLGDFLIIALAFFAAYYGRASLYFWSESLRLNVPFEGAELAPLSEYFIVFILAVLSYSLVLNAVGAYSSMRLISSWGLLRLSLFSSLVVFFIVSGFLFALKLDLSRSFIALFCSLVALSITAERFLVLKFLRFWRRRGRNFRNVIICGISEQAVNLTGELMKRPELGIHVRGFATLQPQAEIDPEALRKFKADLRRAGCHAVGRLICGKVEIETALKDYAIDEVIFTDIVEVMPAVEEMLIVCADQGVGTTIAADLFSVGLVRSGISYFGSIPLIHFRTPPGDDWQLSVKRTIDVVVAFCALLILTPLLLGIGLAVKFSSPGGILFKQRRVGLNGRIFTLYKFRSMYVDAEKHLDDLRAQNEMQGPVFKIRNDPRITPMGRILRRFSLDELPQLWNVLAGHMSLVGPRPPIPGEVTMYERRDRRRLSMRPGITCTWQVSGRNDIKDFESWVRLDLDYIDNWSLRRDFVLLFRTIPAVLFGNGAR